jgi:hypothetical protein
MSRVPGYKSGREVKRLQEDQRHAQVAANAQERAQDCLRSYTLIRDALPLLIEHGQELAWPAEVPRALFGHKLRLAWIVKKYVSRGDGPLDRVVQPSVEQLWAVTEDGRYGQAQKVDRGISALKFFGPPRPLSPHLFDGRHVEQTGKLESELIAERISSLVRKAGLSLRPSDV